jgi:hypothetical protein
VTAVALLALAGIVLLALVATLLPRQDDSPEVAAPMVHVEVRQAENRPYDWQGEDR